MVFNFGQHKTEEQYVERIGRIQYPGYLSTYTKVAFEKAKEVLEAAPAREAGAAKIIVIITDGDPQDPDREVPLLANPAKDAGIKVLPIAIGDYISESNLVAWSSEPKYNMRVSFADFGATIGKIAEKICIGM